MNSKHARHFGKAILALLILAGIPAHAKKPAPPVSGLFLPVPRPVIAKDKELKNEEKRIKKDPAIRRNQFVEIDTAVLDNLALQGESSVGTSLLLNLFPDAFLTVVVEELEMGFQRGLTLRGRVEGSEPGMVLLTVQDGLVSGSVSLLTGQFQVLPLRGRYHAVREIDPQGLPPELQPLVPDLSAAPGNLLLAPNEAAAEPPVIDVLVLYTTAAAMAAGGRDRIENQIRLAESQMNAALVYSKVSPRVSVVAMIEITYNETGAVATDLNNLLLNVGPFSGVARLRDQWGADLVTLIVNTGGNCGVAYMMSPVSPLFAPHAYSVVKLDCATTILTFSHELGHNLGCQHERESATRPGAFSYSHGYVLKGVFRTIMGLYDDPGTPRMPYYSNPLVFIDGRPAGIPVGQPNETSNALTIERTAPVVAAFRPSLNRIGFGDYDVNSTGGFNGGTDFRAMADVDGDGQEDYCRIHGTAPFIMLSCSLADDQGGFRPNSFDSAAVFDPGYPPPLFRGMADVNGDKRADYCRFVGNAPNIFLSCAFAGNGFGARDLNSSPSIDRGYETFRGMADVNGDGRADYCRFVGNAPNIFLSCALASASGFGNYDFNSAPGFDAGYGTFRGLADVNGDGRADYCRFVGNAPDIFLSCALATATGFGNYDLNSRPGYDAGYDFFRAMKDVNDDGRADYCRFVGDFPKAFLSCGLSKDGTFGDLDVNSAQGYDIGYDGMFRGMADVNGDGKGDYCRFVGNAPNIFLSCGTAR